ncbi:DUF805 domain-containing protein [Brevundimonas sp. UBA7664]|uniref:DUF805 domain-containing protein n=1 Tax=Brevundimonas sp. UBA7664 TaxID=1946141 RepID=UPI0025BC0B28|nr:DUF805 domain-containing protein [Brevundimonas sp. UBA7664]
MPLKDLLFGFEGRIRRRDWWIWSIAGSLAYMAVILVVGLVLSGGRWDELDALLAGGFGQSWQTAAFDFATFLPFLWVQTALAAKRAHDRNVGAAVAIGLTIFAGLLTLLPTPVDLLGSTLSDADFNSLVQGLTLVSGVASFYLLVVLGFLDGTPGPNRFGRSPKGIGGDPADKAAEVFS